MIKTMNSQEFIKRAEVMLISEEGKRFIPYRDSLGVWTLGVGKNLVSNPITDDEVMAWLKKDITRSLESCYNIFGQEFFATIDEPRQHAILNMVFQLGEKGFGEFYQTIQAIKAKNWKLAASEAFNSRWAKQTPNRALRVTELLRTGNYPSRYL